MEKPEIPKNELQRLKELAAYNIYEADEADDFDFLSSMAAEICGTNISLISLVAYDKQYFLSRYNLDVRETPKDFSFCAHAINTPETPFVVEDARKDPRFFDNPLTTGYPHVIFYAGIPLVNSNGLPLGTLCVIDDQPKKLSDEQILKLQQLARQTSKLLELRRKQIELKRANEELEQFAFIAAHDLKEPLRGITTFLSIFKKKYGGMLDENAISYIDKAYMSARRMKNLITDILDFSQTGTVGQEKINLNQLLDAIFSNYNLNTNQPPIKLRKTNLPNITGDSSSFIQLFTNLIDNAIKYQHNGNIPEITIGAEEDGSNWIIHVADNGIGIAPEFQDKVFEIFKRLHTETEYSGTGIGLANCKKIVTAYRGKIWYEANIPTGTIFKFSIPKY